MKHCKKHKQRSLLPEARYVLPVASKTEDWTGRTGDKHRRENTKQTHENTETHGEPSARLLRVYGQLYTRTYPSSQCEALGKRSKNTTKQNQSQTNENKNKTTTKDTKRARVGAGNLVLDLERPTGCACSTNVYLRSKETCSALRSGYGPHSAGRATLNISY